MLRVVVIGNNYALYKEAPVAETITPGHLCDLDSSGKLIKHATAAGKVAPLRVAVENDFFGKGIDDAWAVDDQGLWQELDTGCEFMALVAAAAPAIGKGDMVESAGNGTVRKTTTLANAIGKAKEAVDNSGGAAAVRLRVVVL